MILSVRVSPRASRNYIEEGGKMLKVHLTRPASDGEANTQLIELLSRKYKVKKYNISIKSGEKSRNKLIEINESE